MGLIFCILFIAFMLYLLVAGIKLSFWLIAGVAKFIPAACLLLLILVIFFAS